MMLKWLLLFQWQLPGARACTGDVAGRQLGGVGASGRRGPQQRVSAEATASVSVSGRAAATRRHP